MKTSEYKSYDEQPLFLNAETVAKVLGVAPSSAYEWGCGQKLDRKGTGDRMYSYEERKRAVEVGQVVSSACPQMQKSRPSNRNE